MRFSPLWLHSRRYHSMVHPQHGTAPITGFVTSQDLVVHCRRCRLVLLVGVTCGAWMIQAPNQLPRSEDWYATVNQCYHRVQRQSHMYGMTWNRRFNSLNRPSTRREVVLLRSSTPESWQVICGRGLAKCGVHHSYFNNRPTLQNITLPENRP